MKITLETVVEEVKTGWAAVY